jgi:hypothetical protein
MEGAYGVLGVTDCKPLLTTEVMTNLRIPP